MENQEKEVVRPLHELYELLLGQSDNFKDVSFYIDVLRATDKINRTEYGVLAFNESCQDQKRMRNSTFIRKMIEITKPKQQ